MEYSQMFREAKRELGLAEHIMTVTLPFLNDKKIYFNIIEHINNAVFNGMRSFLIMKKEQKDLRIIPESDELAKQLFFEMYTESLGLSNLDERFVNELVSVIKSYKKSQAEIGRGNSQVIVLPSYETVSINDEKIKKYLKDAKEFISKTEKGLI
jgi:CTP:phosphocholine cytidylyltransferase-like protein